MITYDEAVDIIRRAGARYDLGSEPVSLNDITGRISTEDVRSSIANQPFDNSAMDGFALKSETLAAASNDNPVALEIIGRIAAGEAAPSKMPGHGQCYEIMTGAPMPPGCDCVIPVEYSERAQGQALFRKTVRKDENVRHAGEDFAAGETVLTQGMALKAQHILPLATLGIGQVNVLRRPKIALLSTGLEVVDDLKAPLQAGQIYNSSGPYLSNMLPLFGADILYSGTVSDDPAVFRQKLEQAVNAKADLIVSTGAVSAGAYDFISKALEAAGAEILFHKVKIRPGKPVLFAKLPDGGPFYIGLPGNPVASAAGLRFFVCPLIRAMQGLEAERPLRGILKNGYSKSKDFRFFLRAIAHYTDKAVCEVELLSKQQSFMVSSFIKANAWAVAPEGTEQIEAGDFVDVYPFYPLP